MSSMEYATEFNQFLFICLIPHVLLFTILVLTFRQTCQPPSATTLAWVITAYSMYPELIGA